MDKLEQRLNQLKTSYDKTPTISNPTIIMEQIKKNERKRKKKWLAQLPYVASFIGVLIIGSLLAVQLLSSQDTNQGSKNENRQDGKAPAKVEEKVTKEQIEEKHQELLNYYNEQKQALEHSPLHIPVAEEIYFIKEVKEKVDTFNIQNFRNEKELEKSFDEQKAIVQNAFELPKTDLAQLELTNKGDVSTEVMNIIRKQVMYLDRFKEKLKSYNFADISKDVIEQEKMLNSLDINQPEILEFAKFVKENGNQFYLHVEGQIDIEINYNLYLERYKNRLSDPINKYLSINEVRLLGDASLLGNWDNIRERIVILEQLKKDYPFVESEYKRNLELYLIGMDNSRPFEYTGVLRKEVRSSYEKFLAENKDTEAYEVVSQYYTLLQNGSFKEDAVKDFKY